MTDEQIAEWNRVVESGDALRIDAARRVLLRAVFESIMDDDPGYVVAGWSRGR